MKAFFKFIRNFLYIILIFTLLVFLLTIFFPNNVIQAIEIFKSLFLIK